MDLTARAVLPYFAEDDVILTHYAAIRGPATEIGLGASHWIAAGGWVVLLLAQTVGVAVIFGAARVINRNDPAFAHEIRGEVVGFFAAAVASNIAIAVRAGVIP